MACNDLDDRYGRHFKTRAYGKLWVDLAAASGKTNRVLEVTAHEVEFKNSNVADRFLNHLRRTYANKNQLINCRRLKQAFNDD